VGSIIDMIGEQLLEFLWINICEAQETIFRLKNFILGEAEIELTPSSVYETLTILYRKTAQQTSFRENPNQDTFEILGSSLEQIGSTTYGDNKRGGVVCG
jgi:hypothetical protein